MSAEQQLLLRHNDWQHANTLVICGHQSIDADFATQLQQQSIAVWSWDFSTQQAFAKAGVNALHTVPDFSQLTATSVILMWPKSKALALALLEGLATCQHIEQVLAVAANDAGGKSIGSAANKAGHQAHKIDSARRCSLWRLELTQGSSFNWLKAAGSFQAEQSSFVALPGVFSYDRLDAGTALLLEHLPAPADGQLLDLGCGAGVIGLTFKQRSPALSVTLSDVDALALRSAELNSLRLQQPVRCVASDGLDQLNERFDYIICNPPFHQGKHTDYHFAERLFRDAATRLTADGQLWIVANRHLPYEDWAQQHFRQVEIMVQANGFKLLLASQQ